MSDERLDENLVKKKKSKQCLMLYSLSLAQPNHSDSPLTHSLIVWWWWVLIWGRFVVVVGWVMAWTSADKSTEGK